MTSDKYNCKGTAVEAENEPDELESIVSIGDDNLSHVDSSVEAKRYVYDPCPLVGGVLIPDHLFLHYMNCPNPPSSDGWLRRLPKKLHSSIKYVAPALSYGWDVHINNPKVPIMLRLLGQICLCCY